MYIISGLYCQCFPYLNYVLVTSVYILYILAISLISVLILSHGGFYIDYPENLVIKITEIIENILN